MAGSVVVSRWMRPEKIESSDLSPSGSDQVHVLAVDDSIVDRRVIERLLKTTSCKVTAVDSGRSALQYLGLAEEQSSSDGLKVDMVITDYCMPEMTGYELLKKIKESSTFREIPVVIMSSENVLARIDSCLEEGAEDFIVKPVKLADVKRLRDYMTKEAKSATNKRIKVPEVCSSDIDDSTLSSPLSPPSILSTASSASSSPSSSLLFTSASAACSPTPLDSPTVRLNMTELL